MMDMLRDDQWHDAIVYQHSDTGNFMLVASLEQIASDTRPKTMVGGGVKYQAVTYNWNRGYPIVDFGPFEMFITDMVPLTHQ